METLQATKNVWLRINRNVKTLSKATMSPYLRYGLLTPLSLKNRKTIDGKIRCIACQKHFLDVEDAQTHPCDLEKNFREYSGRQIGGHQRLASNTITPMHRVKNLKRLSTSPSATVLNKNYRYGMLTPISTVERNKNLDGGNVRCLACRERFTSWTVAKIHSCPDEEKFRKSSGRMVPINNIDNTDKKELHPSVEVKIPQVTYATIDPEKWVLWNAQLIKERNQLQEENNDLHKRISNLSRDLEIQKQEYLRVQNHINSIREVKLSNEQSLIYSEYNRR